MQISGLSGSYADSGTVARRSELLAAVTGKSTEKASSLANSTEGTTDQLLAVVSQYDITDISPRDFSEMLRELRDSGAITESEYGDLAQIRLDMDAEGLDPDDSLNLLDFYETAVNRARQDEDSEETPVNFEAMERRLDWLQKVAILEETPDAAGINTLV